MAAADYYNQIQQAYIAYYGRPADPDGLEYWAGELDKAGGDLAVIIDAFGNSEESQELYGADTPAAQVNKIYQTLFGRNADMEGLQYYVNGLRTGEFSLASVALDVYNGAQNEDKTALEAKLTYAQAFTDAIDTVQELLGYSGKAAAQAARDVLDTVKDEGSLEEALENVDQAVGGVVDSGNAGQTINLTAALDTVNGTDGNDTINAINFDTKTGAPAVTLGQYDTIDGGKGNDTLNLFANGYADNVAPVIKNVEVINNANVAPVSVPGVPGGPVYVNGATLNLANVTGAQQIWSVFSGTTQQAALYTNASLSTTFGITGALDNQKAVDLQFAGDLSGDDTTVKLALKGNGKDSHVGFGFEGQNEAIEHIVIDSAKGNLGTVQFDTRIGLESLTVTGEGDLTVHDLQIGGTGRNSFAELADFDASASTGKITVDLSKAALVETVKTGTGDDVVTVATATVKDKAATTADETLSLNVQTGAGKDTITVKATGDGAIAVDAGAGDDIINVQVAAGASYNVTAGEGNDRVALTGAAIKTTDVIDGGAGVDTIVLEGKSEYTNADYVMLTKQVKNFEAIEFAGSIPAGSPPTGMLNAAELSAYKSITFGEAGGFIHNVAADQAIFVKGGSVGVVADGVEIDLIEESVTYGGTVNVTVNGGDVGMAQVLAVAENVNLTVNAGTVDAMTMLSGFAKTATVTLNNGVDSADKPTMDTIAGLYLQATEEMMKDLTTLTLKGNGPAMVQNDDGAALVTIDATALGGTFTVDEAAGMPTPGLFYTSANSKAETIKLGSGMDMVTLQNSQVGELSAKTFDTVEGLNLVLNEEGDGLADTSDALEIDASNGGVKKFVTTQTDFDLALQDAANSADDELAFDFGGDTYVYIDANGDGYDVTDTLVKLVGVNVDDVVVALSLVK
ncbi:DUF4214 domain-containing protein [Paracidovorax citrulli]